MRLVSAMDSQTDTERACHSIMQQLDREGPFSLLVVKASSTHDVALLRHSLAERYGCSVHGATSCRGVMTDAGHTVADGTGIGVLGIVDAQGDYGTACRPLKGNPREEAAAAVQAALARAGRDGEVPDLIWMSAAPGVEEELLAGVRDAAGPDVPVVGGSAADNDVAGGWCVFDDAFVVGNGIVVSAIFSSGLVTDVFHNGYQPAGQSGVLTRVKDRRIYEIDGRPAYQVYREWTGNALPEQPRETTSLLALTTPWPLGRTFSGEDDLENVLLVHPTAVYPDGSFEVFARPLLGETVHQMTGTSDALINRSGQVAGLSRSLMDRKGADPVGALVVFCGGCMLSVQDRIDEVVENVRQNLDGLPFLGVFTFGEQGRMPLGGNLHGNLMISCVTFGR